VRQEREGRYLTPGGTVSVNDDGRVWNPNPLLSADPRDRESAGSHPQNGTLPTPTAKARLPEFRRCSHETSAAELTGARAQEKRKKVNICLLGKSETTYL